MAAERWARCGVLETQVAGKREDQHDQNEKAERRPASVAPSARMAEATAKQC